MKFLMLIDHPRVHYLAKYYTAAASFSNTLSETAEIYPGLMAGGRAIPFDRDVRLRFSKLL
jgi:hypothetical protein